MKYIIGFLLISISFKINAQIDFFKGYIIKNNNDTVYGLIKLQSGEQNGDECFFRKDPDAKSIKYLPEDLLGYRFINGKYFVSKKITYQLDTKDERKHGNVEFDRAKGTFYIQTDSLNETTKTITHSNKNGEFVQKQAFLEFIINGNVDVYVYYDYASPKYFIEKETDSLIHLANNKEVVYNQWNDDYINEKKEYIGILKYLLNDCDGIQSKITNTNLNNKSLIKLAKYYHNKTCSSPDAPCIVYEKKDKVYFSLIPAINYSYLNVTASDLNVASNYDFTNKKKISYAINLKLSNFQYFNYHLSTQIGLNIQKQEFESEDKKSNIQFTVLEIPVGIYYSFLINSKFNPFIGLSANPYFRLKKGVETTLNSYALLPKIRTSNINFSAILGGDYYINKNMFVSGAINYKIGGAFYNYKLYNDNSKSNTLLLSIGFGYVLNKVK